MMAGYAADDALVISAVLQKRELFRMRKCFRRASLALLECWCANGDGTFQACPPEDEEPKAS